MQIINFKSNTKVSPFAPEWNYFLGETYADNVDFKSLKDFLLEKEKYIKNLPIVKKSSVDGYTGLGVNSTTARYDKYNLFDNKIFIHEEIDKLKFVLIEKHNDFLNKINIKKPDNLYVQCWYNVMRKGEYIKPHIHGTNEYSYLGCHICVEAVDTHTYYMNTVNQINDPLTHQSKNEIGKMTFFQSCIPHFTDVHKSIVERITIAMDLSIKPEENYIQLW